MGTLGRKGRRVLQNETEAALREKLGQARAKRDKKLEQANTDFSRAISAAEEARAEARKTAWAEYDTARAEIVKQAAKAEAAAA